jgi:hypothetical protein
LHGVVKLLQAAVLRRWKTVAALNPKRVDEHIYGVIVQGIGVALFKGSST